MYVDNVFVRQVVVAAASIFGKNWSFVGGMKTFSGLSVVLMQCMSGKTFC